MDGSDRSTDDPLLPIGRFARLAGLSVGALRHYDELDLLRPTRIDPDTGYRSYRSEQLEDARLIARLRELEMPLEEIRLVLATDDPAERRRVLADHRTRVQARSDRLRHVLHHLSTAETTKEPIMSTPPKPPELDPETRRTLAAGLFNRTWELLETAGRTPAQDDEMIHAAHASRYHWGEIGRAVNLARGEWQCARVYSTLGRGEPAMWHATRCLAILEADPADIEDWDLAAAYEGLARASFVAGDTVAREQWTARAREALEDIADPEDRTLIEGDLDAIG
jgi:DNA-binding transcriptional MerR regulator